MELIYSIRNMKCAYNTGSVVLHIQELEIPEGKVVFFVGPSGVGKSTILETLGLMNNTIASVDEFRYCGRDLRNAFKWNDSQLSDIRNQDFSFVFQQNNLMPNFSAQENIITAALFQGESSFSASKRTAEILKRLNLPPEDRPINQYSGGQQQRIAFARAILPKFKVLFGDEPTGNLDKISADNLMKTLVDSIHENGSTAIIVSHDITLSLKYADIIVQIHKEISAEKGSYGLIFKASIYTKEEMEKWKNVDRECSTEEVENKLIEGLK